MAWSFETTNLGTDTSEGRLNAVRSLIQDTDEHAQQLQNEEIALYLAQTSNDIYLAAAMACDALAAKYARFGDTSIDNGGISVDYQAVTESYRALSVQMRRSSQKYGTIGLGKPSAGGISREAMRDVYEDTDRVDPAFRHRQFRNPAGFDGTDDDDRIR